MTAKSERRLLGSFRRECGRHDNAQVVEEHGSRFVSCFACGALWGVHFDQNRTPIFESMEQGDESCRPHARRRTRS